MRNIDHALSRAVEVAIREERKALRARQQADIESQKLLAELTELSGFLDEYTRLGTQQGATLAADSFGNKQRFARRVLETISAQRERLAQAEHAARAARLRWQQQALKVKRLESAVALRRTQFVRAQTKAEQRRCDETAVTLWCRQQQITHI